MLAFILQRLIQAMVVMVTVAFIAFLLFQYVGDPVVFLLGQDATQEQIDQLRADLGLNHPFFVQFWHFLVNAVQGEFGLSLRQGAKVSRLIAERFPATLELALVAAGLALLIGIPMGVYAALRRGSFMSQLFMTLSLLGVSLPTFLIGILLILVFAVGLGWFPSFGRGTVVQIGWWTSSLLTLKGWHHIVLPSHWPFSSSPSSCVRCAPKCSKCCAPTTSSSRVPAACPTAPSTSAMPSRTRWCRS
jgi:peptide/nickel transport system permease protein